MPDPSDWNDDEKGMFWFLVFAVVLVFLVVVLPKFV